MASPIAVAVGILLRPDGRFLLNTRPAGKPCAGSWEFPGGKMEPGETVVDTLRRELREELAIEIGEADDDCRHFRSWSTPTRTQTCGSTSAS
jgi:8-oxo-dGTP diphosphatase